MSVSIKSPTSKKSASSKSKSNHNLATPGTTTSPAPAHVSEAPTAAAVTAAVTPPPPPTSPLAAKVIAQLDALEASLNLDIVIAPNDKAQIGALNRVSDTAIGLASDIVSAAPDRFPDFTDLPAAASYVQTMGQIASRATELATHVQKSVLNQRAPAAVKTLALYAVVKGLGRITDNETMREKVPALKAEVSPPRKNPKPKVTKGEKAVRGLTKSTAAKVAKAYAALAKAGITVPGAPAPATANVATVVSAPAPAPTPSNGAAASAPSNGAATATPPASH